MLPTCKGTFTISMCQKDEKENLKKYFRFSPDFTHFSLKHNGCRKKTHLLAIHEKSLVDFFQKSTTFSKCDENQIFFREGIAHPLNFFGIKSHDDPTSHRHLRSKRPKKNPSLSTVQMTLKTLLLAISEEKIVVISRR